MRVEWGQERRRGEQKNNTLSKILLSSIQLIQSHFSQHVTTYLYINWVWVTKICQAKSDAVFVKKTELHFHISTKNDSAWWLPQAWGCLGDNSGTLTVGSNGKCLFFFPFKVGTCNVPCYTAKPFLTPNSLNTTCPSWN